MLEIPLNKKKKKKKTEGHIRGGKKREEERGKQERCRASRAKHRPQSTGLNKGADVTWSEICSSLSHCDPDTLSRI